MCKRSRLEIDAAGGITAMPPVLRTIEKGDEAFVEAHI
jgi:hypothetical protein